MANGFQGPPAVDFYSMLSGLGDTIAKNRADGAKRDAYAAALTPDPATGKVDFGKAIMGLAQVDPHAAAVLGQVQAHQDSVAQADRSFNHTVSRDKIEDDWADTTRNDSLRAHADSVAIQRAQLANTTNKPFDISVPGPFGSTTKQTVVRGPDGSVKPVNLDSGVSPVAGGAFGGMSSKPLGFDDGSVVPQAAPGPPPGAPPAGAPPSFSDRFAASAPQSVAPPAAPAPQADLDALDPATGRREAWLGSRPAMERAYIKKIADYEIDPRTTSTKGGMRENVLSSVAQYDPTYNQNEFGTRAKAMRDFGTGQQGNSVRSFDVATAHLDTLQKYVDALKSGDIPLMNSLRNKYLQATGNALPTNVQAIAPIVGAEVSKAIIGSNNALADREELRKPLNSAGSPEQLSGAIQSYKELMTGQLRGLKKQYEDTTGKKNFNSRISENTRNILLGGEGSGAPPPPKVGEIQQGHRFNGGNPADPNSWSVVQ